MLNKISQFQKDAVLAGTNPDSISELKLWLKADCLIPGPVKEADQAYIELKELKHKLTKLFHDLTGEDSVDMKGTMEQLDKALENLETMLSRYA